MAADIARESFAKAAPRAGRRPRAMTPKTTTTR
jgi:hypothetical protein